MIEPVPGRHGLSLIQCNPVQGRINDDAAFTLLRTEYSTVCQLPQNTVPSRVKDMENGG